MQSHRQELEFQNITNFGASNRVVWGSGIRYDIATQPLLFSTDNDLDLHQSRIFAHDEWRVTDALLMNMGGMYEDDGVGHKNTSPRVSINYHIVPQHTLRVSASAATRNPVLVELYMRTPRGAYWKDAYAPPLQDIRPEKIQSREIGYIGQFGQISVDGRIFYDKVSDIILLDAYADTVANSFKNLVDANFKGVDVSANYHWENGRLTLNYTRQKTSCWLSSYPTQYFNPTLVGGKTIAQRYQEDYLDLCNQSVPAQSGSLLWSQQLSETFQFSLGYYLRSKVRVTDVSNGYPPESQMRRIDMRIANTFGQKDKAGGGEIALVLQNAFQDNYTGYGNVPQRANLLFKRRTYLTATIFF
jgi:iron complex outermembrane receptor protein